MPTTLAAPLLMSASNIHRRGSVLLMVLIVRYDVFFSEFVGVSNLSMRSDAHDLLCTLQMLSHLYHNCQSFDGAHDVSLSAGLSTASTLLNLNNKNGLPKTDCKERPTSLLNDGGVPEVVLEWYLRCYISNSELATFANVCQEWRRKATHVVALESLKPTRQMKNSFLVSMIHESLVERQIGLGAERDSSDAKAEERKPSAQQTKQTQPLESDTEGSYCLAWFAPSGIQTMNVRLDEGELDHQEREYGRIVFNGVNSIVQVCKEWRGYRGVKDVLIPFGFAASFVTVSCFVVKYLSW